MDNFMETQTRKLKWLSDLQEKYDCPILCGGDLFNYHKPSPWLLSYALRNLPDGIISTVGQHDLPAHSLDNIDKSGIQVLKDAGKITLITSDSVYKKPMAIVPFPWGKELRGTTVTGQYKVALIHYGVYESVPHYPGAELSGGTAKSVMNKMKGFDLIISGDNHLSFACKSGDQVLCNPGSFMRVTAAQIDHKPSVYLWYAETNEVERVYIPIETGVISREHIEQDTEKDIRLDAFISQLRPSTEITVNFKQNITQHIAMHKVSKSVSDLVWSSFS
jgi:hypothetical protein